MNYSLYIPRDIVKTEFEKALYKPLIPLETGFFERAKDHRVSRLALDESVLLYCVEGAGRARIGGQGYKLVSGDLLICPENHPHSYAADDQQPWTIYWLHFKGTSSSYLMEELGLSKHRALSHLGVNSSVINAFRKMSESFRQGYSSGSYYETISWCHYLFSQIMRAQNQASLQDSLGMSLDDILDFLKENIEQHLSLDELAEQAGMSKYHFSRKFKEATGDSPMAFFLQLKLQRACELLDTTNNSIKAISLMLGFTSPYYFSAAFKRLIGLSPDKYRKRQISI